MTPRTQSEPPDERQVANSAGGYAYPVDDRNRLDRFLILGSKELRAIFHRITQGTLHEESEVLGCLAIIRAFEQAKTAIPYDAAALVRRHKMTWEMMPAKLLQEWVVWEALAEGVPPIALVRNLATLTRLGVLPRRGSSWPRRPLSAWANRTAHEFTPSAC